MRFILIFGLAVSAPLFAQWTTVGQNAQHTGISTIAAQPLSNIRWQTQVTQDPNEQVGTIFIHFGAPIISPANTVFVPVRGNAPNHNYSIEVHSGATGSLLRTFPTDWTPPPSAWVPSYGPGLSVRNVLYFPGAGGTIFSLSSPDTNPGPPVQLAFYGISNYIANPGAFNSTVSISTPIVSDRLGNIFFGFIVTGSNPSNLTSGIARISSAGVGSWVSAATAANLSAGEISQQSVSQLPINSAPALSNDHATLYFGTNNLGGSGGYLVAVNSTTLAPIAHAALIDPLAGVPAQIPDISSASPVVSPDGDVYYGVLEKNCPNGPNPCANHDRGWLMHFTSTLGVSASKPPGAFGWDSTPSIVPYSLVPSYAGHSGYLIFSKYNNYFGSQAGGDGRNKIAVLDPNDTQTDPITGVTVMKEVITILGQTTDGFGPPTVREWCINSAAIDKVKKSAIVNSEDGKLYRWDFATNSFTEQITLTGGIGEAYTPTVIGPDGTAYAINDGKLFAVGN
jgi:hypothetical protein